MLGRGREAAATGLSAVGFSRFVLGCWAGCRHCAMSTQLEGHQWVTSWHEVGLGGCTSCPAGAAAAPQAKSLSVPQDACIVPGVNVFRGGGGGGGQLHQKGCSTGHVCCSPWGISPGAFASTQPEVRRLASSGV